MTEASAAFGIALVALVAIVFGAMHMNVGSWSEPIGCTDGAFRVHVLQTQGLDALNAFDAAHCN